MSVETRFHGTAEFQIYREDEKYKIDIKRCWSEILNSEKGNQQDSIVLKGEVFDTVFNLSPLGDPTPSEGGKARTQPEYEYTHQTWIHQICSA